MGKYSFSDTQDERREARRPKKVIKPVKIKPATKKRARQLRKYSKENKVFLEGKVCQFPGCESIEVTNHHSAGRQGEQLLNFSESIALCWPHHQWVEDHPEEAKKLTLSIPRLKKTNVKRRKDNDVRSLI